MAGIAYKNEKPLADNTEHRIRLTLTSQDVKSLEKGLLMKDFVRFLLFAWFIVY
ncbi:hypothetical protein OESDEN_10529 [Oesophagostomum dentatum]|uniref:Uncharacterized protein n=1 Tax=Oesophagostomum dentatum TaxID=61180 RepID=A0A0B1T2R9_OESDE|nr:hypothetical protein OESDEN_10529 [Oesophagostomum dentatum]